MKAIVYTSNAGHTSAYAEILGKQTGLPVYSLTHALKTLSSGTPIIYMGWLFANTIKGYQKAKKKFHICAICAVGLCDTGTGIDGVRKVNAICDGVPVFTMQGGMDKTQLQGINKFMIKMLIKAMSSKKNPSQDDKRVVYLLNHDKNYVNQENTTAFMQWYNGQK